MPHGIRVLVVDDDRGMVESLLLLLDVEGYNAKGIYSAQTIVADVRAFDPDVIIMDIAMPGRSGWEGAEDVRKHRNGKRPMLIAVSGQYTTDSDRILADLSGFDYYIVKPCDPKVLLKLAASYDAN